MALPDAATTTGDTTPPDLGTAARHAAFLLPAERRSVSEARHRVLQQLRAWGILAEGCDTAALVVSELFANAVIHTSSRTIAFNLGATPEQLLIQVVDDGSGPSTPRSQRADTDAEFGRGLLLVQSMTERWGVGPVEDGAGRIVWATVRLN
ncbi:ATP-binding protein [Streptomyces sp. NPDC046909]|uniref:ATP-binding protein n=1 Tax=Streptomyces sp. NPDC046909 TaxID=3155617 RepID=UPI0033D5073B